MGKKAEQVKEKIAEIENVKKQIWALQKKLETLSLDLAALTEQSKSRVASLSPVCFFFFLFLLVFPSFFFFVIIFYYFLLLLFFSFFES